MTTIKIKVTDTHRFLIAGENDFNAYSIKTGKIITKCRNDIYRWFK